MVLYHVNRPIGSVFLLQSYCEVNLPQVPPCYPDFILRKPSSICSQIGYSQNKVRISCAYPPVFAVMNASKNQIPTGRNEDPDVRGNKNYS